MAQRVNGLLHQQGILPVGPQQSHEGGCGNARVLLTSRFPIHYTAPSAAKDPISRNKAREQLKRSLIQIMQIFLSH